MADSRRTTLLDFAVIAALAVLPVMLVILLLVAVVRPSELSSLRPGQAPADRYLSVRHVAALQTFEQAIRRRAGGQLSEPTAAQVLDGIPRCRGEWRAGWLAPLRGSAAPSQAERIATQLAALDAALLRFGTRPNARVAGAVGLDVARWFDVAQAAVGSAIETPDYPGQRFELRCADLAGALSALLRADARMLESLAWRGTEPASVVARWRADQVVAIAPRQVARRNPWNGVAGCIYLGTTHFVAAPRSAQERLCVLPEMSGAGAKAPAAAGGEPTPHLAPDDPRWSVPPSLQAMLQPLESLRSPTGALYRLYTDTRPADAPATPTAYRYGPNRIVLDGAAVDVGFSVALTIDPQLQALAQKTAACYTGRQDVCRALGIRRAEDKEQPIGHRLLEHAMVRMAAVAVVDIATGRIEALAGALSPCARQEVDGPGRDTACDKRLPYPVRWRPDALLNPAVFHDAMPASTVKPIMAAAFLADPEVGPRGLAAERAAMKQPAAPAPQSLRGQLMRSDSARFLDRMFCSDKDFAECRRAWEVQRLAAAFGWNAGCSPARVDCGKQDLLFGRAVDATAEAGAIQPLATTVAYGRLMSEPVEGRLGAPQQLMPSAALNPAIVRRCADGADGRKRSDDDWEKCRGGAVVDVVAEGWGQGHARSSALGVAGMMATLAGAANGQDQLRRPHLVDAVRGVGSGERALLASAVVRWDLAPAQPNPLSRDVAEVILSGLSFSHRNGTARSACEQVFDAKSCREIGWLAGKTGTPSFPSDGISLDALAKLCAAGAAKPHPACSSLRPYKWYVAAYRSDPRGSGPWTKAIAVLSERNWIAQSGQVHGASDHGPNPSAEIAMQVAGRSLGVIPGAAP